ncbi:DUF4372 domain-containing protein [Thermophagus xiamenensis]|uniref:DUF4372 domain-containing protein n=1 Tax=Thermophagus xiamenensis TaxID=385682 RepID=UPI000942CB2A
MKYQLAMKPKITLFLQFVQTLCRNSFKTPVQRYEADKHNKGNDCWIHLITMLYCLLSRLNIHKM